MNLWDFSVSPCDQAQRDQLLSRIEEDVFSLPPKKECSAFYYIFETCRY